MIRRRPKAFSLVEVTLSIGILAFALVSILGLLPVGLKTIRAGTDEMAAVGILGALETDLRASPASSPATVFFAIDRTRPGIQGGAGGPIYISWEGARVARSADAAFRLIVENLSPLSSDPAALYRCRAKVSWPAEGRVREDGAGPEQVSGSVETYFAFRPL